MWIVCSVCNCSPPTVSPEGIASYAHMILVEGIHRDYLPSVVRWSYSVPMKTICIKLLLQLVPTTSWTSVLSTSWFCCQGDTIHWSCTNMPIFKHMCSRDALIWKFLCHMSWRNMSWHVICHDINYIYFDSTLTFTIHIINVINVKQFLKNININVNN